MTTLNAVPPRTPKDDWPAVDRAYDFVLPSYQWLLTRFEAADTRLTTLINLATSLTLAVPLFAKAIRPEISFTSRWFLGGILLFVLAVVAGLVGRLRGELWLPHPTEIYNRNLRADEWTFKKNALYFAGEHFAHNAKQIDAKARSAVLVAVLLALEVLLLVRWLAR
jgi:hypothetical protein